MNFRVVLRGLCLAALFLLASIFPTRAAMTFDGTNGLLSVAGFGSSMPNTAITIEFWQKVNAAKAQYLFGLNPDQSTNRLAAGFLASDSRLYWDFGNITLATNLSSSGRLSAGNNSSTMAMWNHFAFVANDAGNQMQIYQNGNLVATRTTLAFLRRYAAALQIGGLGGTNFGGSIEEFRVWNTARTDSEIQANMKQILNGNEPGLVLYYQFKEGSGTSVSNTAGTTYPGLLTGGATFTRQALGTATLVQEPTANLSTANFTATFFPNGPASYWVGYHTNLAALNASVYLGSSPTNRICDHSGISTNITLTGLIPNTTYFFRLTVTNEIGGALGASTNSSVVTFTPGTITANAQTVSWERNTAPTNTLTGVGLDSPLTFAVVEQPVNGSIITLPGFATNGMWYYRPPLLATVGHGPNTNGFYGLDRFTFQVMDATGHISEPAQVDIVVTRGTNNLAAPTAHSQLLKTRLGQPLTITLTGDDDLDFQKGTLNGFQHYRPDINDFALNYTLLTQPTNGYLTTNLVSSNSAYISPNLIYTPTNSAMWDGFTFKVNDGQKDSPAAAVTIRRGPYFLGPYVESLEQMHSSDTNLTNPGTVRPNNGTNPFLSGGVGGSTPPINGRSDDNYWYWDLMTAGPGSRPVEFKIAGNRYPGLFLNNNGLVSFQQGVASWISATFPLAPSLGPVIAPFWGDVDTRATNRGGVLTYSMGTAKGRLALFFTWNDVGVYNQNSANLNRFQLVLIDRSDFGPGEFDMEFNYEYVEWLTGLQAPTAWPAYGYDFGTVSNSFNGPQSVSPNMAFLPTMSNCGIPGRFTFHSFSAPPVYVTNLPPYNLSRTEVLLQGTVMPNGERMVQPYFQISRVSGGNTNFFTNIFTPTISTGQTNPFTISAITTNLPFGSNYIVSLVASNDLGMVSQPVAFQNFPRLLNLVPANIVLSPAFSPFLTNYSSAVLPGVSLATTAIPENPLYQVRFRGNDGPQLPSADSIVFTQAGTNYLYVDLVSTSGNTVNTYVIAVNVILSNESRLSSLVTTAYPFVFSSNTTNYSITIPTTVSSITVSGSPVSTGATVAYRIDGGVYGTNGVFTLSTVETHVIEARCTSASGASNTTYRITVNMPKDNTATLSSISLTPGSITGNIGVQYFGAVNPTIDNTLLTVSAGFFRSGVSINGGPFLFGTNFATVPLSFGTTSVPITIRSESETTFVSYTVIITRPQPVATTLAASNILSHSALLSGTLDAKGADLLSYFEWGTNAAYGNTSAASGGSSVDDALSFNGVNRYASFSRSVSNDFTIEFWFKSSQVAGGEAQWYNGMGLVDGEVGGVANDFGLSLGNGKVLFGIGNPDVTIKSGTLADGNWHHVAATRAKTNGAIALYIDGALAASGTGSTNTLNAPAVLRLGSLQTGLNYFNGSMDEVRFWNRIRTPAEILQYRAQPLIGTESNLVAYYRLDEGSGTTTADATGQGRTGTLFNSPAWVMGVLTSPGSATNFSATISGLLPGTLYHYRFVATNAGVTATGGNLTFRTPGTNTTLGALSVTAGTLSPAFHPATNNYTVTVDSMVSNIQITAITADTNALVQFDADLPTGGSATKALILNYGSNPVTIKVTAQDGVSIKNYQLTINRPLSSNADLASLSVSAGTLFPIFSASTTNYTIDVTASVTNILITAAPVDAIYGTVQYRFNGGSFSGNGAFALIQGISTADVRVTAQDGSTKTYTITIAVAAPLPPMITGITTQPNQTLLLQFSGESNVTYMLQTSTNLPEWENLTNVSGGADTSFNYNDLDSTNHSKRFYRLKTP